MTSKKEQFYIQHIAELEKQLKQRDDRIATLEKQVAELIKVNAELTDKVAKLSKNSSNSSKPPSSDIVKPPRKTKNKKPRNIGGQPGHTKHERTPFTTDEIDAFHPHTLDACPDCGGKLKEVENAGKVVQQVEVVKKPIHIEQHTALCYWCEHCQKFHYAPMPDHIEKGQLIGPRLTAVIAYMKDFDVLIQFCIAHLIRELKYLAGLTDKATANYGQKLLDAMRDMFSIFHNAEELTASSFAKAMEESRKAFLDVALIDVPDSRQAQNLANRFRKHGDAYFRFITTPGIGPTNNLAEQAIRFVVIDRYITQGTRSENGRLWSERIWTVLATCASQSRNAFEFICQSIQSHFSDQPLPSLLGP